MSRRDDPPDRLDALARAAASGDEEAFEALVRRVHRRVFRWALGRLGDPDEAEDTAQKVLLRLHRHLPEWRGEGRVTSWLYRITANVASNHARGLRPKGEAVDLQGEPGRSLGAPPGGDSGSGIVRRLYAREVAGLVETFFRDLPARQRQIFDLVDLQGLEPAEVAELLDMNGSTVRANLFKARRTIRLRVLEEAPELEEGYAG